MGTKVHLNRGKTSKMKIYLFFFRKNFGSSKKSSTFATAFRKDAIRLGYGVMVTLQILVLPFLVRVRVPQQRELLSRWLSALSFFYYHYGRITYYHNQSNN